MALGRHGPNINATGYLSHTDSLGHDFKERPSPQTTFPIPAESRLKAGTGALSIFEKDLNEKFTETGIGVGSRPERWFFHSNLVGQVG